MHHDKKYLFKYNSIKNNLKCLCEEVTLAILEEYNQGQL